MSLVHVLTLFFISRSLASQDQIYRNKSCPPGYHHKEKIIHADGSYLCQACGDGYFMDKDNTDNSCIRCNVCEGNREVSIRCTTIKDTQCRCKDGYFWHASSEKCCSCSSKTNPNPNCRRAECQTSSVCSQKNQVSSTTPTTTPTTASTTTTTTTERKIVTSPPGSHEDPSSAGLNPIIWVFLVILVLPLIYCVPVLFVRNLYKYLHLCPRWKNKQDMEAPLPTVTDQARLQSLTTLNFTISEETPMMEVMSPVPPECPAHSTTQLPEGEHSGNWFILWLLK